MAEENRIQIRAMESADVQALAGIDHSYHTDHVWQMEFLRSMDSSGVTFTDVRLPRSMRVDYPRAPWGSADDDPVGNEVFVGMIAGEISGYIKLDNTQTAGGVWIKDIAVRRRFRRQGVGTAMVVRAQKYALDQNYRRVFIEMQSKNYPGICMANKLGFEFSGFADQYYENQDIALFFKRRL